METNIKNPKKKEETDILTLTELQSKTGSVLKRIGVAADHGGFELKEYLIKILHEAGYEVVDFGNSQLKQDDDYPDFVIPLAKGELDRGVAICGSGVGACVAMNKVKDVRACLVNDTFSARQGVEDDNLNALCLRGRVIRPFACLGIGKNFPERTIYRKRTSSSPTWMPMLKKHK